MAKILSEDAPWSQAREGSFVTALEQQVSADEVGNLTHALSAVERGNNNDNSNSNHGRGAASIHAHALNAIESNNNNDNNPERGAAAAAAAANPQAVVEMVEPVSSSSNQDMSAPGPGHHPP